MNAPAAAPVSDPAEALLSKDPALLEVYQAMQVRHASTRQTLADILGAYNAAGLLNERAQDVLKFLQEESK